jgi:GTP-binding protein
MGDHALDEDEAGELNGETLFRAAARFIAGAASREALPPAELPEVAFIGRSNVGKSSLINALTFRRALARISRTPGRTQQINFFALGERLILADLPGYGFARVAKAKRRDWAGLARDYLAGRPTLRRALVLIDARHGVKEVDREAFAALDRAALSFQIVLTKTDLVPAAERDAARAAARAVASAHVAAHPDVALTSAADGLGLPVLRAALAALALAKLSR